MLCEHVMIDYFVKRIGKRGIAVVLIAVDNMGLQRGVNLAASGSTP